MDRTLSRMLAAQGPRFLASLIVLASSAASALAEVPRVVFDMPYAVSCRDITPAEFAANNPADKLVEVKLGISSLLQAGTEKDLAQYFIRIEVPQRTMAVSDFLPKTAHEALKGNTTITKNSETTFSLGVNITGHYQALTGTAITPGVSQKNGSCVKFDLLPPLETVTASGTILRGSGVYYKLKSSERNLLEGEREFALIVRVPKGWRGDYLHVRCEAEGISRGLISSLDQRQLCGQRDFLIALYLEGDSEARRAAEDLSRAEIQLRNVAHVKAREIQQRMATPVSSQFGVTATSSGSIPADWQARLLFEHPSRASIPKKLPREVVQAAQDFRTSQQEMAQLSGWKALATTAN
jgi:hypothetical protein